MATQLNELPDYLERASWPPNYPGNPQALAPEPRHYQTPWTPLQRHCEKLDSDGGETVRTACLCEIHEGLRSAAHLDLYAVGIGGTLLNKSDHDIFGQALLGVGDRFLDLRAEFRGLIARIKAGRHWFRAPTFSDDEATQAFAHLTWLAYRPFDRNRTLRTVIVLTRAQWALAGRVVYSWSYPRLYPSLEVTPGSIVEITEI